MSSPAPKKDSAEKQDGKDSKENKDGKESKDEKADEKKKNQKPLDEDDIALLKSYVRRLVWGACCDTGAIRRVLARTPRRSRRWRTI